MIYDVRHVTTYAYEAPVTFARCTLRLIPCSTHNQRLLSHALDVTPEAASTIERTSFFGHRAIFLVMERAHRAFRIEASSRVAVDPEPVPHGRAGTRWEEVREAAFASREIDASSPVHYLYPSRLVPVVEPITRYARESFPPERDLLEGAIDLMNRIRADFVYDPRATVVSTPVLGAFENRRGVCQDFAHLMTAGLRGIGVPAAYVSGYIRTIPAAGARRLRGADATHAWVSVWCGNDAGWIGFDPTNGILVADSHITLAVGRDYADVSPIDGVIQGSGTQSLQVEVDVAPVA